MNLLHVGGGLIHATPRLWRGIDGRRHRHRVLELVPRVLEATAAQLGSPEPTGWVVHSSLISSTRMAVLKLGPPGCDPVAVLKIPATPQGAASQAREARTLAALAAETRLGTFERLLPIRFAVGAADGRTFTVERALPGIGAGPRADTVAQIRAIAEATSAIGKLHRHTAHEIVVDAAVLDSWIGGRVTIAAAASRNPAALRRLSCRLHAAWMGRRVSVGWVHGDFWLGNVLVDPKSGATTGIVDWEWAGAGELPAQDVIYACIHGRMQAQRRELGDVVAGLLGGAEWEPHERALLRATGVLAADRSRVEDDLLLLVWLRQVAYNLIQDPGLARSFIWVRRNLDGVLRLI